MYLFDDFEGLDESKIAATAANRLRDSAGRPMEFYE